MRVAGPLRGYRADMGADGGAETPPPPWVTGMVPWYSGRGENLRAINACPRSGQASQVEVGVLGSIDFGGAAGLAAHSFVSCIAFQTTLPGPSV